MRGSLLHSLLELGHATSQNLGFAHRDNIHISYGEETITETNLLELQRRHPAIIRLSTFSKKQEALNGADWEWHIIGRSRKLKMRVQAKRLQKDNKLKIPHKVASSGQQQIDLLIADAKANQLKPVYCLYASETQRCFWRKETVAWGGEEFESGCLLASAHTVKAKLPKALTTIEEDCVPWHYLVEHRHFAEAKVVELLGDDSAMFLIADGRIAFSRVRDVGDATLNEFPVLDELNSDQPLDRVIEGIVEKGSPDYERRLPEGEYLKRGISKLLEIDVSEFPIRSPQED